RGLFGPLRDETEIAESAHRLVEILHRCGHGDPRFGSCGGERHAPAAGRGGHSSSLRGRRTRVHSELRPPSPGSAAPRARVLSSTPVEDWEVGALAQPATERSAVRNTPLWLMIGPGLLLAATGVGSGDLATGGIAGSLLGPAVLWAVLVGAVLKYVVTEGLTRWQLATGETLLEGVVRRLGPVVVWLFLPYLLLWSFFVGSAQVSEIGR